MEADQESNPTEAPSLPIIVSLPGGIHKNNSLGRFLCTREAQEPLLVVHGQFRDYIPYGESRARRRDLRLQQI